MLVAKAVDQWGCGALSVVGFDSGSSRAWNVATGRQTSGGGDVGDRVRPRLGAGVVSYRARPNGLPDASGRLSNPRCPCSREPADAVELLGHLDGGWLRA